jgi:uncharacterized protein YbcV (DUF1398 family)
MNTQLMRDTLHASEAGKLRFPEVLSALAKANVESYRADFIRREDTFYLPDGQTHIEAMQVPDEPVADRFTPDDLVATIRAVQADTIRYPEFVRRAMTQGVSAYQVFLHGGKVIYFGGNGETHTESFPIPTAVD